MLTPDDADANIDSFQTTWQSKHPFSLFALYDSRVCRLGIQNSRTLIIYFAVPEHADRYVTQPKSSFLKSQDFAKVKLLDGKFLVEGEVREMWRNTEIRVIRPTAGWEAAMKILTAP